MYSISRLFFRVSCLFCVSVHTVTSCLFVVHIHAGDERCAKKYRERVVSLQHFHGFCSHVLVVQHTYVCETRRTHKVYRSHGIRHTNTKNTQTPRKSVYRCSAFIGTFQLLSAGQSGFLSLLNSLADELFDVSRVRRWCGVLYIRAVLIITHSIYIIIIITITTKRLQLTIDCLWPSCAFATYNKKNL